MRRNLFLVVFAVFALLVALYLRRTVRAETEGAEKAARDARAAEAQTDAKSAQARQGSSPRAPGARPAKTDAQRAVDRAQRDALRAQIVAQLATRADAAEPEFAPPLPRDNNTPPNAGKLRNGLTGRDALVDHLNHDFMPLAHDCITQAKQRNPQLTGMVGLGIETLSDDTHGGIVEAANHTASNNVADPELLECIRESAYSLSIPGSLLNGREKFELTLPVGE